MSMDRYNLLSFIDQRRIARSCKDKTKGHMINTNFRLHYNEHTDTVDLVSRWSKELLASKNDKDETVIKLSDQRIHQLDASRIFYMYGARINKIQNNEGLSRHQSYFIHDSCKDPKRFVYVANGITIDKNGKIIKADDYLKSFIDKDWNKNFIATSKRQRAKFHALHIMCKNPNNKGLCNHSVSSNEIMELKDVLFNTDKPTGKHLDKILNIVGGNIEDLRSLLQRALNDWKWEIAEYEGQVHTSVCKNVPC